jgi:hypothetical protein
MVPLIYWIIPRTLQRERLRQRREKTTTEYYLCIADQRFFSFSYLSFYHHYNVGTSKDHCKVGDLKFSISRELGRIVIQLI